MKNLNIENDVSKAIDLLNEVKLGCEKTGLDYNECCKIHAFTNEALSSLFKQVNFENTNSALTVLSSGDQLFNFILNDVLNVDTFDLNLLTKYYVLGIKIPAIDCLTQEEFKRFLFDIYTDSGIKNFEECFKYVINNSQKEYKDFWNEYLYQIPNIRDVLLLFRDYRFLETAYTKENDYLNNSNSYIKLKNNLQNSNINFIQCNITDVPKLKSKYDFIYLSNILDYMEDIFKKGDKSVKEAIKLILKIYKSDLEKNGEMIYKYNFVNWAQASSNLKKIGDFDTIEYNINDKYFPNCSAYSMKK